jgi:hypothetical protein
MIRRIFSLCFGQGVFQLSTLKSGLDNDGKIKRKTLITITTGT